MLDNPLPPPMPKFEVGDTVRHKRTGKVAKILKRSLENACVMPIIKVVDKKTESDVTTFAPFWLYQIADGSYLHAEETLEEAEENE